MFQKALGENHHTTSDIYIREKFMWVKARKSHSQFELSKYWVWKLLKKNPKAQTMAAVRYDIHSRGNIALILFCVYFRWWINAKLFDKFNLRAAKSWFFRKTRKISIGSFFVWLSFSFKSVFTTRLLLSKAFSLENDVSLKKLHFTAK